MDPDYHNRIPLSQREAETLRLASRGMTDKQIATHMGVRLATVRTFWNRIREKLHANNRGQAIAIVLGEAFEGAASAYDEPAISEYIESAAIAFAVFRRSDQTVLAANDAFLSLLRSTRMALRLGSANLNESVPLGQLSAIRHGPGDVLSGPQSGEFVTAAGVRIPVSCSGAVLDGDPSGDLCLLTAAVRK